MSGKLKALGLGILAAMAMSALSVIGASAQSQSTGHFTFELDHTTLDVNENSTHKLEFGVEGLTSMVCDVSEYEAPTIKETTVTDIAIKPANFIACHTTGGTSGEVTVNVNGCYFTFAQPNKKAATTEHTVSLVCPTKSMEVIHPSCTFVMPGQSNLKGIGYTTYVEDGKHAITATVNVTGITVHFHKGLCVLLGTKHTGSVTGSVTATGTDGKGNVGGVTATGSES